MCAGTNRDPLVSVVIATYNRAKLIGETIQSILDQTFTDFELIIVSDGSTDNTDEIVASFADPRIRFLQQANSGRPAVPRNLGIRESRGKYVAFSDDDDIWLPGKLAAQLHDFPDEGISCVATDYEPIGDVRFLRKSLAVPPGQRFKDFSYEEILFSLNPVVTSSVLARKDYLAEVRGFDEDPLFRFIEDWELWLQLSRKGKVRILSQLLLQYRMCDKADRDARQVTLNSLKILEKHHGLGYLDRKMLATARGNCSLVIGRAFLDVNDMKGIFYYCSGLLHAKGMYNKAKSAAGILLFLVPSPLRRKFVTVSSSLLRKMFF